MKTEYVLLNDFLYEAIFIPKGVDAPSKNIIHNPELQVYVKQFGKGCADHALIAEVDGHIVGAVWVRNMKDYGHIDDDTPSLAISLYKQYRGLGIGMNLMKAILSLLKEKGYQQVSLAVQKENYALHMYQKIGFETIHENNDEYIMVKAFI